jgi:hypothetical protein
VTNKLSNGALDGSGRGREAVSMAGALLSNVAQAQQKPERSASRRTGRPRMAEATLRWPFLLQRDVKGAQPAA